MKDIPIWSGQLKATVSPVGGTVTTFTVDDAPILYPWHEADGKARGGSPICAPWFGSSPRAEKKHGHLRDLATEDMPICTPEGVMLMFTRYGDERYPWTLDYMVSAMFSDGALVTRLSIQRIEDSAQGRAPILPAFHPYFTCEDADAVEVCMGNEIHRGFEIQSRAIPLASEIVLIKMPKRTIEMKLGGAFSIGRSRIVLWTDSPNSYACVEPVLGDKQLFDTPEGHALAVGERVDLAMSLRVL